MKKYRSEYNDVFDNILTDYNKSVGRKKPESNRSRAQQLRRLKERVGVTKNITPKKAINILSEYIKEKYTREEIHEYDRYGLPKGTDVIIYEDDSVPEREFSEGMPPVISYDKQTIGGGYRRNSRFNIWIRDVLFVKRPDLKSRLDSIEDNDKRNKAFKRLSYILRRSIAERGLVPDAYGLYDKDENLIGLKYNSGKIFKIKRRI